MDSRTKKRYPIMKIGLYEPLFSINNKWFLELKGVIQ